MAELFGFKIERSSKDSGGGTTFSTPTPDDGTIDVAGGGFFGQILDTDGRERTDLDLIRRYRDIAQQAECDTAIEDIINEGIVANENDQAVEITLRPMYPTQKKLKEKFVQNFMKSCDFLVSNKKVMTFFVDGMWMDVYFITK